MTVVLRLEEALRLKERLAEKLASRVGREGLERAKRDSHSKRSPIPCGLTVHTGIGCGYGCVYCSSTIWASLAGPSHTLSVARSSC